MNGRVVVVTGSTRGIGLALARACVEQGARVVVNGRDAARVAEVASTLGCIGIAANIATAHGADALVRGALDAHGRIDVLVNNAATTTPIAPLWQLELPDLAGVVATNLVGPMLCAHAALAWAVPRGEPLRIINVSSGVVAMPRANAASYVAGKAGLEGFTRALAFDAADTRVVVTAVALGGHRTELSRGVLASHEYAALPDPELAAQQLLRAITAPSDEVHGRVLGEQPGPPLDIDAIDLLAQPAASPRARAALVAAATDGPLERYPERPALLRKVLAARFAVPLDSIVIGGGISELFDRVLGTAMRAGETLIANAPSWPLLPHLCRRRKFHWRAIPYQITTRADHDLAAIVAAIDRSVRLVYLTSPANPGGAALDTAAFERFLDAIPRHVTVVVDEAYAEFATRPDALDATRFVRWTDKPLVVLRTFSKFHGLAGLRIGYAVATRDVARELERAAPPFIVARGAETAAIAALADTVHTKRTLEQLAAARTRLEHELDDRGIARLASDAPFLLAALPNEPGPRFFDRRYVMLPIRWATDETTAIR